MLKRIFSLIFISILISTAGCAGKLSDEANNEIHTPDPSPSSYRVDHGTPPPPPEFKITEFEDLFALVGKAKFGENSSSDMGYAELKGINELYIPSGMIDNLLLSWVEITKRGYICFRHEDNGGTFVNFIWDRAMPTEIAMNELSGRGEIAFNEITGNSLNYSISKWEEGKYSVFWVQHNQSFSAFFSGDFTENEILEFCNAQPVIAWEIQGDAVSVSIEGAGDVVIYDGENRALIIDNDTLSTDEGGIGYRWLIDAEKLRYQYVLAPGEYLFSGIAADVSEITVRHYAANALESEISYTEFFEGEVFDFITLSVTPEGSELGWVRLPPSID